MELAAARRVVPRTVLVWLTVTAAAGALGAALVPSVAALPGTPAGDFADVLTWLCAVAALVAAGALWVIATDVAWRVLRCGGAPPGPAGAVRRAVLVACGVGVLVAAAPAGASAPGAPDAPGAPGTHATGPSSHVLQGLPLPDRATAAAQRPARAASDPATVRVRRGDSLWSIAAARLGPGADGPDVAAYWRRIHALNAGVIGADPDHIEPGQSLRLPPV